VLINNVFVTSGQFADILTFLTGQRIYMEKARNVMKLLPDTIKQEGRYTINREDAWDYFRDNYSGTLHNLKIENMEELLSQTKNM
jgi:hypothetical protein